MKHVVNFCVMNFIRNDRKQDEDLSPRLQRRFRIGHYKDERKNQEGMEMNGTHQL
jgi:hypothetical protein